MGEADPEAFAYTLTVARLGETANNKHAAVMNTVFKSDPSEVECMKRLKAGGGQPRGL